MAIIDTRLLTIDKLEARRQRVQNSDPQKALELLAQTRRLKKQVDKDLEQLSTLCRPWHYAG